MIGDEVRKMYNRFLEQIICKARRAMKPVTWANIDTDDMATQQAKAVEDIIRVCHQTYDMYHDDNTVRCKYGQEYCDRIVFAFLHMEFVEIVMLEKLDCILSKSATRPYIYEYKCECVRTHLCIDPSGRQQSPVIRDSPLAIRESSPAIRWQRPIMQ
jgi:hypothetical protein